MDHYTHAVRRQYWIEQIRILNQRHFGRKTESAHSADQLQIDLGFNDAEAEQDPDVPEPAAERRRHSLKKIS